MKSTFRVVIALAMMTLFALSALAAVSAQYSEWGNGPAKWLMTKDEADEWKRVETDAQAAAFMALFWARRDPTPETPANEFKAEFDARVKYADERFSVPKTKGSLTERGRALIVLGPPVRMVRNAPSVNAPPSTVRGGLSAGTPGGGSAMQGEADASRGQQVWMYEQGRTKVQLGQPTLELAFTDQRGNEDWRMTRTQKTPDFEIVLARVNRSYITQPNLTVAPTFAVATTTGGTPAPKPTAAPTPAQTAGLKTESLLTAAADAKGGTSPLSKNASITYAELVAPTGEYYVPVQLYVGKAAGLTVESGDTFFGIVEDATGTVVTSFEEPAKLLNANGDVIADKTLDLGTGKYRATLGIAKAGTPVAIASTSLELTQKDKTSTGTSKLLLWNSTFETPDAAPVKAPFAFGKLKIVPKGNLTFSNKDELGYFVEVHNPGIDPATNLPSMQMKVELGGTVNGKAIKSISAPLAPAPILPLTGAPGPGQYAVIQSIPLGELTTPLAPGDYVIKVKLIDNITKQTYNLEQSFKITG